MYGGDGDDTYHVDSAGDTVNEKADEGHQDTVRSDIDYELGPTAGTRPRRERT